MAEQPKVVAGYADAIVAVAEAEGALDRVEDELYRFAHALERNKELRERLTDASIDIATKLGIIGDLLQQGGHPQTVSVIGFVVQAGQARQLSQIAQAVVERAAALRAEAVAEVRSAVPLNKEQQRRLGKALEKATGSKVSLKVIVDPEVVGGLVVKVGDTVIDGSVSRRLGDLRARMVGN